MWFHIKKHDFSVEETNRAVNPHPHISESELNFANAVMLYNTSLFFLFFFFFFFNLHQFKEGNLLLSYHIGLQSTNDAKERK